VPLPRPANGARVTRHAGKASQRQFTWAAARSCAVPFSACRKHNERFGPISLLGGVRAAQSFACGRRAENHTQSKERSQGSDLLALNSLRRAKGIVSRPPARKREALRVKNVSPTPGSSASDLSRRERKWLRGSDLNRSRTPAAEREALRVKNVSPTLGSCATELNQGEKKWLRGSDLNRRPPGYEHVSHNLNAVESIAPCSKMSPKSEFCHSKCNSELELQEERSLSP